MEHNPFTGRPINGRLLLTVSEAAAALRISRSSIYRLFDGGELAWVQIGASRRVTSAEIHRFIAECRRLRAAIHTDAGAGLRGLAAVSPQDPTHDSRGL
jgi:excisionase family DNA binding protein